MAVQATVWVWEFSQSGGFGRLVLLAIANRYNLEKRGCWPSIATISRDTRVSTATVKRAMARLVEIGEVLNRPQRTDGGSSDTNFYSMPKFEQWLSRVRQTMGGANSTEGVGSNGTGGRVTQHQKRDRILIEPVIEPVSKKEGANSAPLPEWLPLDSWNDFVEMRKKIKKPLTTAGVKLALAKLNKFRDEGESAKDILEYSILNSYQGLFSTKESGGSRNGKGERNSGPRNAINSGQPCERNASRTLVLEV